MSLALFSRIIRSKVSCPTTIHSPGGYGSSDSGRFKKQLSHGFGPVAEKAKFFDLRFFVWLGPDNFGDTLMQKKSYTETTI